MVALFWKVKNQKNKCPATQDWFSKSHFRAMMGYYASIINHIMEKYLLTGENVHGVLECL